MASSVFDGGYTMTAALDVVPTDVHGATKTGIVIEKIVIEKSTAGTVRFRDGSANNVLITESIADGARREINFGGWWVNALEYRAVSAGTATIRVFTAKGGRAP
jgi:hypothetical protein